MNNMNLILCLFLMFISGCSGQQSQTAADSSGTDEQADGQSQAAQAVVQSPAREISPASLENETLRNPFLSPDEEISFSRKTEEIALGELKISAIFYNGKKNCAIINGKIIDEGDSLDGKQIVTIDRDAVHLKDADNSYIARIGDVR